MEAYRDRGLRADYVHSRENSASNDQVLERLENHELDVIVQVRKLGEGFDHPFLAVAAVFGLFANFSPSFSSWAASCASLSKTLPEASSIRGVVVFHAGANVAGRWDDFRNFREADQEFFNQLLPDKEDLDFRSGNELEVEPAPGDSDEGERIEVRGQTAIQREEIPLVAEPPEARVAPGVLQEKGYSSDEVNQASDDPESVPVTRVRQRQTKRLDLDTRVQTETLRILRERSVNPEGRDLGRQRFSRSNFVVVKAAIDRQVNATVGRKTKERSEFTRDELDRIERDFPGIVERAEREVFDGAK